MKAKDLTGKTFGHLKVIGQAADYVSPKGYKSKRWLCQCDCGNKTIVHTTSLTSGATRSCGHLSKRRKKIVHHDLDGKRFDQLTVIKDDGTRRNGYVTWLCRCDCGKLTHVRSSALKNGSVRSCGHEQHNNITALLQAELAKEPGTLLNGLNDKPSKNNQTGYRNISFSSTKSGDLRYRVAVVYKRKQYGGFRKTLPEALDLREHLRQKLWPNYNKK